MTPEQALALLAEERRTVESRLHALRGYYDGMVEASRDTNADDEHDPEGVTIAYERSQVGTLVRQAQQHLVEIAAAEDRVRERSYGTCERCGTPVPDARLEARPTARTCVRC